MIKIIFFSISIITLTYLAVITNRKKPMDNVTAGKWITYTTKKRFEKEKKEEKDSLQLLLIKLQLKKLQTDNK